MIQSPRNRILFLPAQGKQVATPGGGAAAAFSPDSLANLELWLDANDLTTLWQDSGRTTQVANDGDPVGAWDGKSVGNKATQSAAGNKPLYKTGIQNGLPGILADGSDDFLTLDTDIRLDGDDSIFIVFKRSNTTTVGSFICKDTGNNYDVRVGAFGDADQINLRWFGDQDFNDLPIADTNTHLLTIMMDGSDSVNIYGDQTGATENPTTINIVWPLNHLFGRRFPFAGYFFEFIKYSRELTADERSQVETYLNDKWSIF